MQLRVLRILVDSYPTPLARLIYSYIEKYKKTTGVRSQSETDVTLSVLFYLHVIDTTSLVDLSDVVVS